MVAFLGCRLMIGYRKVVALGGIILRTGKFVPLGCIHIIAHSDIHDAGFYGAADGILAIDRVRSGVHAVALNQNVGTTLVLYRMVEPDCYIPSVGTKVYEVAIL